MSIVVGRRRLIFVATLWSVTTALWATVAAGVIRGPWGLVIAAISSVLAVSVTAFIFREWFTLPSRRRGSLFLIVRGDRDHMELDEIKRAAAADVAQIVEDDYEHLGPGGLPDLPVEADVKLAADEPAWEKRIAPSRGPELAHLRPRRDHHRKVTYDDLAAAAFAQLVQPGRLVFNPPDRMQLGSTERVEVRLTRTLQLDALLLEDLRGHGKPQMEGISTAPLMSVTLAGDGFQITAYSDEEQSVAQDRITTWEFDIRALKRGQQRLVLSVSLRIPVPDQPSERTSIPVHEATIDVQVGTAALVGHFVSGNWQWFVGTAIAIAAVLVAVLH
jgi:hypothetical protein